ncbi:hypothetical protein EPR50_G00150070 [Xyrichtys novacula]|uniref:Biotinidase n=1 Tax=Xyrichtys novacula TaxID=13765 RepID=A0AAV1G0B4_XYRNO|nr:hypothetical protein EPR50_G00150070 [Xyrichtys novacula]
MACRNNIYIVANMPDRQPCPLSTEPTSSCPSDGRWQFNTNIAFRSDGLLVARYHKYNLFHEESFDTPPQPEIITFDTPFAGKFGLLICFDVLFYKPTIALVEKDVRQLIFPTAWFNTLPLLDSVQYHQSLSRSTNITLLAANLPHDNKNMAGSGIYTPFSSIYHHSKRGDPEEGKLLVARVLVLDPEWSGQRVATEEEKLESESTSSPVTDSGFCHSESYSDASSVPSSSATFTSFMIGDPFTFVLLNEKEGRVKVCNGSFCCHLQYKRISQGDSEELYAFGAFAGLHTLDGDLSLQVCALVRCAGSDPSSCGQGVEKAETKMDFVMEGKFGTRYVYPSVLASQMVIEEVKHFDKSADGRVTLKHSDMTAGLVTAFLYGQMYHLDHE